MAATIVEQSNLEPRYTTIDKDYEYQLFMDELERSVHENEMPALDIFKDKTWKILLRDEYKERTISKLHYLCRIPQEVDRTRDDNILAAVIDWLWDNRREFRKNYTKRYIPDRESLCCILYQIQVVFNLPNIAEAVYPSGKKRNTKRTKREPSPEI